MAYSCRHSLFALFLECAANVTPEFDQTNHCLWSKNIANVHLPFALQLRKMSTQLTFRKSFTTVELIDTGSSLCVTTNFATKVLFLIVAGASFFPDNLATADFSVLLPTFDSDTSPMSGLR